MQYCRWLSEQEDIPEAQMCYPPVSEIQRHGDSSSRPAWRLAADFLRRTGYRLPTEAEWEYACRADTKTSRYYGSSEKMLTHYAWYLDNSDKQSWPVGQKKPNDFGLFDMHGHRWQWCQEDYGPYDNPDDIKRNRLTQVSPSSMRVLRGGGYGYAPNKVRSARRYYKVLRNMDDAIGFRVARTHR